MKTALRASHEGISSFSADREAQDHKPGTSTEAYDMLQIVHKMNTLPLTVINRNAFVENEARALATRITHTEQQIDAQTTTST